MAKYVLPAASAVARSRQVDASVLVPLRPVLVGPRAGLHRFSVLGERASLGAYDPLADTAYDYPDRSTGSVIDLDYVKLYAADADLNFFNKYVGSGGSAQPSSAYPNRVRAANYVFKTANDVDRSADFYDRDVKIGDIVTIRGVDSGDTYNLETSVTGFVGEVVAASTGAVSDDDNNADTQSAAASITQTSGTPINDVVATADESAYLSTADGYITRTYTVTVTQSSTGNDATTALLRVRSSDGLDDADDVAPEAFGDPTAIGTKGLTVTFDIDTGHSSSSLFGIDEDDLVVGQQWVVTVSQAFTAVVATSSGTYTGTRTTTYVVLVSRGGRYVDSTKPQITVTSTNGYDRSGPTTVTAAATPFAVGSYGVLISFAGTYLRKGDKYYITATAAGEGALKTLVLKDDVPEEIRGVEVDLRLFARRTSIDVPSVRTTPTATTNWTATDDSITVADAISIIDDEFTDGGDPVPVPLEVATLYVEYREWVTTGAGEKVTLNNPDDIAASLGIVDPDNPIAYAASEALANTYGELVDDPTRPFSTTTDNIFCLPVGGDPSDTDLWTAALETLEGDDEGYQLVPCSDDPDVLALFRTHITAQSEEDVGLYRVGWFPAKLTEVEAVVSDATSSDEEVVTATITDDTDGDPRIVTASSNANFVTNAVRAGDTFRTNYGTDDFGDETYDEYTIASVTSQTTLVLSDGPDAEVTVGVLSEVWRTYTKDECVDQIVAQAELSASDRIRLVWPDQPGFGGTTLAGYNLCAALSGLAGSVPSHQGLRNVGVEGVDDLTRSSRFFTATQLQALAAGGVCVVTQTPDGRPYVLAPNTTDPTSTTTREEMIVRNADMLRKAIQDEWAPYVGSGNVISNLRPLLDGALASLVGRLRAANVDQLGPAVGDITIASMTIVSGSPDTVEIVLNTVGIAVPLNQIRISLPISV